MDIFKSAKYELFVKRHECFTGKYTTCKIHKNYIRDPSGFFHNLPREFIDDVISVISLRCARS